MCIILQPLQKILTLAQNKIDFYILVSIQLRSENQTT